MNFHEIMEDCRLISIIRGIQKDQVKEVIHALYAGGIRIAEITFDSTGKQSDLAVAEMIELAAAEMNGKMCIGAGTVLTAKQAELTKQHGGEFIISPNLDFGVMEATKNLQMVSIPAAMTVSEIVSAQKHGADYIKIFPSDALGGPAFFKAVRGPFPNLKLLAVSGVTLDTVSAYRTAGAYGFGIGSAIVNKTYLNQSRYDLIAKNASDFAARCRSKGSESLLEK